MPKQTGMASALYINGYDVGGDTQAFTLHGGINPLDVTDITQSAYSRLGGLRDAGFDWTSYHDTAANAAHAALAPLPLTDVIATALISPVAIGCPAVSMNAKQIGYDPARGQDASLTFAVSLQAQAYGQEWGIALTPGRRVDTAATAAGAANSWDTGASAAFGGQAYFHLLAFSGTSVTLNIWDSADNITFAAVTGFTSGALTVANTAVRDTIANNATIRRYIAVASVGTFTNADFAVQVTKNATSGIQF